MKTLASFLFVVSAFAVFAQDVETFDLASYRAPAGWKKVTSTRDVVSYAVTNNQQNSYCQIAIYASTNSKGSLQADFDSEWDELIVKVYKTKDHPDLVPAASENGWAAQGGVAPFEFSGGQSIAMLITMSGYDRCMSIAVVTNTDAYKREIENFLSSVKPKALSPSNPAVGGQDQHSKPSQQTDPAVSNAGSTPGYHFTTTNFDDGWTSSVHEDWVQVTKGSLKVILHYPNKNADTYNSVLLDGLKNAWNVLVAPRYSSVNNMEFKPVQGWQPIEFAEADAIEKVTRQKVYVVLFKMNYSNGSGKYIEFIAADKNSFEKEFGVYQNSSSGLEKMERMINYNKFAVAAEDLHGMWTNDFSGALQYVNAYTGANAGMATHATNERFEFGPGNSYKWNLGVASGMVGNIKFQSVKSNGVFKLPNNWQVTFSDIEGKPRTYDAHFSCVRGARLLWLGETCYGLMK